MKKNIIFSITIFLLLSTNFAQTKSETVEKKSLSYGLVLDNSGTFRLVLENLIKSADRIIQENDGDDKTFIVRFVSSEKIKLIHDLSNDTVSLTDSLNEMYVEGGQTAITEAIFYSAKYLVENENSSGQQKVLVVITDGEDRLQDKKKMQETLEFLQKNQIKVYFLGVPSLAVSKGESKATKFMKFFAEGTKGEVFIVDKTNSWNNSANNLVKAMKN